MHEAQVVLQVGSGGFFSHLHESLGDQAFLNHLVHLGHGVVGIQLLTGVMQLAISADPQEVLTGLQAAHAEQGASEAEHIHTALVVVVFTGEQALHSVGAIQGLGVGHHAAQQGNQLVSIPGSVLADEQIGTLGAVVAIVSGVDVGTQHVDSSNAVQLASLVHLGNDVAGSIIVLGDLFHGGAVQGHNVDLHGAGGGHVGGVHGGSQLVGSLGGEFTLAVQQLLHPVNAHQGHTLDVVHAVEVGGEVDGAGIGVAGDGQAHNGVGFQISLEVGHHVQVLGNVHDGASLAVLRQLGSGAAQHVNFVQTILPEVELVGSAVALVLVLELHAQDVLDLDPGGLQVASQIGLAVGQGHAFAGNASIEEQTGLGIVVAGGHAEHGALGVGQFGAFSGSRANEHGHDHGQHHQQRESTLHSISSFFCHRLSTVQ